MSRTKIFILICSLPVLLYILFSIYPFDLQGEEADLKFLADYSAPEGMIPIFYREEYDITLFGIEKLHPFDSEKYGKVFNRLVGLNVIQPERTIRPLKPNYEVLLAAHTDRYLQSLRKSGNVARIAEILPLRYLPGKLLYSKVLNPMLYAAGGTLMAANTALHSGWAINLGGGFHHASEDEGGGFCVYADISLAIKVLRDHGHSMDKAMIIDLDAHQGNGHEKDFLEDDSVYILDMYNSNIYPYDFEAKRAINRKIELKTGVADAEYLETLSDELDKAFLEFQPDLILYNAGTDIMTGDPLGGMNGYPYYLQSSSEELPT